MSLELVVRQAAKADLREAMDWNERQSPGLGDRYLEHVDAALERIRLAPEHFAPIYKDVRHAQVERFPYVVYFV